MSDSERIILDEVSDISIKYVETRFADVQLTYETKFIAGTSYRDGYVEGRASALKNLEQVAREAFDAGRYGKYTRNSIMPRPLLWSEVQHDFDYKEFEDFWQKKTESKEAK